MHGVVAVTQSNYYECGAVFRPNYASLTLHSHSVNSLAPIFYAQVCVFAFSIPSECTDTRDSWGRKVEIIATAQFPQRGGAMKESEVRSWITWCEPPERKFDCGRPQRKILRSSKTRKFMFIRTLQQPTGDGRPFGRVRALGMCVSVLYIIFYYLFIIFASVVLTFYRVARVDKWNESRISFFLLRNVGTKCQQFFFSFFHFAKRTCENVFLFLDFLISWNRFSRSKWILIKRQSGAVITWMHCSGNEYWLFLAVRILWRKFRKKTLKFEFLHTEHTIHCEYCEYFYGMD